MRKAACAVGTLADDRLVLAVALYRREYHEVTRGSPESTGLSPAERTATCKRKRQTPAEKAAKLAQKQEKTTRKDVERACAVRAPWASRSRTV